MLLSLLDDSGLQTVDLTVEVPDTYAAVIRAQLERLRSDQDRQRFNEGMLRHLARVMGDFLDSDLRPPTEKQVAFAFSLAKQQAIEVPRDALIYRSAMSRFLESRVAVDRGEDRDERQPEPIQRPTD